MLHNQFARIRLVGCLVLLLALGAALLPPHRVSAEEQVVVIPKEELQVSLLHSLWQRAENQSPQPPASRVEQLLVNEILLRNNGDPDYQKAIDTFRQDYRETLSHFTDRSYETLVYRGLDAIDLQKKNLEGGEKGGGTPSGRLVFATTRVSTGGIPWTRL